METELQANLLELAERFCEARGLKESTVGRMCAADGEFFSRLRDGKSFTARKYDAVVRWFSENWPEEHGWPAQVIRPTQEPAQ
ncbi:hypothetical protein [Oceaniradius stylonematis]|uniref:hypothetical protein n=1 Tax=Oceaniradius stylonematis TaxID=2184161 RepID=UPI00273F51B1|nr:hypothetical protein [Oceaniradius stylonematis]